MALIPDRPDRRQDPRFGPLEVKAVVTAPGHAPFEGRVRDVSRNGVYVSADDPRLPFRSAVRIKLADGTELAGEIIHVVDSASAQGMGRPPGYGIQLISPPADLVERVARCEISRPSLRPAGDRRRVVVIDDDERVGRAVLRALSTVGLAATHRANGRDGWAEIESAGDTVDLVIVDALLPDIAGEALIRRIRSARPETPIIAISGLLRRPSDAKAFEKAGAQLFMVKPFTAAELCKVALRLVNQPERSAA